MLVEPLPPDDAKRLILRILATGDVAFSSHATSALTDDDLTTVDVINVLRGGVVEDGEFERRSWRYRVRTAGIYVVVTFRSEHKLVVVTAWRIRR